MIGNRLNNIICKFCKNENNDNQECYCGYCLECCRELHNDYAVSEYDRMDY